MDGKAPLVSVIIPAYNAESFIQETIESVLAQTWRETETIVIDDGSTDRTSQIVARFTDKVHYVYQENRGLGAARNTGLHLAKGDYFAFLDADDLWAPGFLELQVKNLFSKPETGISYSWWGYVDRDGQPLPERGVYSESGDLFAQLVLTNRFPVMAALVRRSVIEKVGEFDTTLPATEDWDYWLRAAQAGFRFNCLPVEWVYYRIHSSGISRNPMKMQEGQIRVLDKLYHHPELPGKILQLREQAYARIYLITTASMFLSDQVEQAYYSFRTGVYTWPDLLVKENTYHTLICSQQPPGYRSTYYYKNLDQAQQRITNLFEVIFKDPALAPQIKHFEHKAAAVAKLTLAHHYYLEGENKRARELIVSAVKLSLSTVSNHQGAGLWMRSLLGRERIHKIKSKSLMDPRSG